MVNGLGSYRGTRRDLIEKLVDQGKNDQQILKNYKMAEFIEGNDVCPKVCAPEILQYMLCILVILTGFNCACELRAWKTQKKKSHVCDV